MEGVSLTDKQANDELEGLATESRGRQSTNGISRPTAKPSISSSTSFHETIERLSVHAWLSLLASALILTAIIVILHHYDDREQPDWNAFSLNTLISFLSTLAEVFLSVPIGTSIDQLKWVWFATKRHPISELSDFDAAGRDIMGSAKLLFMHRAR